MSTKRNPKFPEGINASQENPLKEFVLLLTGIGLVLVIFIAGVSYFAQALSPYIPYEWEQSWIPDDIVTAFNNDELTTPVEEFTQAEVALNRIFEKLKMQQDNTLPMTIHLIESDVPNAFATLGGHIFIHTGLLPHIQSENGLAMVIAHEMAHIQHRHPIQSLSRGLIIQLTSMMLFSDNTVSSILGQASYLTLLSFNRNMETEADHSALGVIQNHYGHRLGTDEFFKSMMHKYKGELNIEFFNTHPNVEHRIEVIQANQTNGELTPLAKPLMLLRTRLIER